MTEHEYRTMSRFANSDLTELSGKVIRASADTLLFGSLFHQLVLEPHRPIEVPQDWVNNLLRMQATVREDNELSYLIHRADKEVVRIWNDSGTSLPVKAKIDAIILPKRRYLIDLKTTACASLSDFADTIDKYDYDRQAAFYLSSDPEAEYFEFVGVQKNPPFQLYRATFHRNDHTIKRGRKKMELLLGRAAAEYQNPNGWRPSSWSRKPETV